MEFPDVFNQLDSEFEYVYFLKHARVTVEEVRDSGAQLSKNHEMTILIKKPSDVLCSYWATINKGCKTINFAMLYIKHGLQFFFEDRKWVVFLRAVNELYYYRRVNFLEIV